MFKRLQTLTERLFREGIQNREVVLYYDPDTDGLVAGHILYRYLSGLGIRVEPRINELRLHGIKDETGLEGKFVINVDSGVSMEQLKSLVDRDVMVVSFDHHQFEDDDLHENGLKYYESNGVEGLIYNVQYDFLKDEWGFLSGAGVVWYFLKHMDSSFNCKERVAEVGITLLSDVRDIYSDNARKILETTYQVPVSNIKFTSLVYKELVDSRYTKGHQVIDRNFVDYTLSPYLNGLVRIGMHYEAIMVMRGQSYNLDVKALQREVLAYFEDVLNVAEASDLVVGILNSSVIGDKYKFVPLSNFLGYVANRLMAKYKKPVIIMMFGSEGFIRGSFRGGSPVIDYLNELKSLGLDVAGHTSAFGIRGLNGLSASQLINTVFPKFNELLSTIDTLSSRNVVNVFSLKKSLTELKEIAYDNQFKLSQDKTYVNYTGINYYRVTTKENYSLFKIEGIRVVGFKLDLELPNTYLVPTMVNGLLDIYLEEIG